MFEIDSDCSIQLSGIISMKKTENFSDKENVEFGRG